MIHPCAFVVVVIGLPSHRRRRSERGGRQRERGRVEREREREKIRRKDYLCGVTDCLQEEKARVRVCVVCVCVCV